MKLSEFIRQDIEKILQEWEDYACTIQPEHGAMNTEELRDHARKMLLDIADELETSKSGSLRESRSRGQHPLVEKASSSAVQHGIARYNTGSNVDVVLGDYRALRASVMRLWNGSIQDETGRDEIILFNEEMDGLIKEAVEAFTAQADRKRRLLEKVISSSQDHCYILHGDGKFIYANDSFLNHINIDYAALMGNTHHDLPLHSSEKPYTEALKVFESGEERRGEVMYSLPFGEERFYEYVYEPILDTEKEIVGVAALERDITERKRAEKALRQSESRFREIFSNTMVPMATWKKSGEIIDANDGLLKMIGCTRAELEGGQINWVNITPTEYHERDFEAIEEVEEKGFCTPYEKAFLHKDGHRIPIIIGNGTFDRKSEVGVFFALEQTKRKQAEEALKRSEEQLQRVFQIETVGILFFDMESNFTDANDAFLRMIGWNRQMLEGGKLSSARVTVPEWMPRTWQAFEELKATGRFSPYEKKLFRPDGTHWWGLFAGTSLGENEAAEFVIDITDRKHAEEELRESEEKFRSIFEQAAVGIGRVSFHDSRWIDVNDTFRRMVGYTQEELQRTPWPKITHPDDIDLDLIPFQKMAAGELESYTVEKRLIHKEGYHVWAKLTLSLVRDSKALPDYEIAIIENISERKKAEEALQRRTEELAAANRELESFSYSVSHDLRAPLRTISGFSSLLRKYAGQLDDKANEYLQRVDAGVKKMDRLIDDMLSLSKISRHEMVMQEIDLSAMAKVVVSEFEQQYSTTDVETHIADGLKARGDAKLIEIALTNLLTNAWKYSSKKAEARVEFGSCRKDGKEVFFIRDNGAGFPMDQSHRLFQPFQRLHSESEFTGTGVGLPIVYRVISRHGGEIRAEGDVGRGATFYFTFGS